MLAGEFFPSIWMLRHHVSRQWLIGQLTKHCRAAPESWVLSSLDLNFMQLNETLSLHCRTACIDNEWEARKWQILWTRTNRTCHSAWQTSANRSPSIKTFSLCLSGRRSRLRHYSTDWTTLRHQLSRVRTKTGLSTLLFLLEDKQGTLLLRISLRASTKLLNTLLYVGQLLMSSSPPSPVGGRYDHIISFKGDC